MNTCNCFSADGWRIFKTSDEAPRREDIPAKEIYTYATRRHLANCHAHLADCAVQATETPQCVPETPRTDAQPLMWENRNLLPSYQSCPADFARKLERELNEAKEDADKWMQRAGEDQEAYLEVAKQLTTTQQRLKEMTKVARDEIQQLRVLKDNAYIEYIRKISTNECLGEEAKLNNHAFGQDELEAHKKAYEFLGKYRAYGEAINLLLARLEKAATKP